MFVHTERIKIDRSTTASFDVDPQNGFTPVCPQELPVEDGHNIVDELNKQAMVASLRVVSKDAHPANAIWIADENNPQLSPVEGDNVDIRWHAHCVPGTKGFELIDGLPPLADYDFVVYKGIEPDWHPYGACYHDLHNKISTGVIEYLKIHGIKNVIVGGLALDFCVKLTAIQLVKAGFFVMVNIAGCRAISDDTKAEAVTEMEAAGVEFVANADVFFN